MKDTLLKKIENREAKIGIVGLGYVGLPLLIEFARAGFPKLGLDVDEQKTEALAAGETYIRHIGRESIREVFGSGVPAPAEATTDFARVRECDALLVCVPTPLTHHRDPPGQFFRCHLMDINPGQ